MNEIFQTLKEWECDIEGAMERFLDDKELYLTCLQLLVEDSNFAKLGLALEEKDVSKAFDSAHTLKGVFANLGLTPMFALVEMIVEPLRVGNADNLEQPYQKLFEFNEKLKKLIAI